MKFFSTIICFCAIAMLPAGAYAERSLLSVVETVDIDASPDEVWAEVGNFDGMANWHPAIASSQIVAGENNRAGAARELQIKDGPAVIDELVALDDAQRSYIYRLVDSPLPLTDYLAKVTVKPNGEGSEVIWSVTFRRKNAADNVPDEESDQAAIGLLSSVYRGGLDNLKQMLDK